jgi:TP901 family phage tail tape measure protein
MATQDISQLVVEVKSQGIQTATNQLNKLADASDKAEASVTKLGTNVINVQSTAATSVVNGTKQQTSAIDTLLAKMEEQVALLGANSQETAAYRSAMRGATDSQIAQAVALGASIDAYKAEQAEIKASAKAQAEAAAQVAAAAETEAAAYASAQAEAVRMNATYDANIQKMGKLQAAAIAMNEAMDSSAAAKQAAEYEALWNEAQKLNLEYDKSVQAMGRVQAQALEMNAAMDKRAAAQEAKDFESMYQEATKMNIAFDAAIEKQLKLNAAFEASSISSQITKAKTAQNYSAAGGDATATYGSAAATADVAALTAEQKRLAAATAAARAEQDAENAALAEANALARGLSGSFGALWVTYGNIAGMAVGIAIGASLKGVIDIGKDVENTLESIRVLGGATVAEVGEMGQKITELGQGTQGPKDVAEALQVLTMAGLNAKDAMTGVGAALNLSVAGGVGIEKSAETLVQVGTALGYTADGYDHVADVIAKAAAVSMSSVDSISGAFKSAAAVGEVYGASLNDIAVGLAAVANLGIQGTAAGTALKNLYKDLSASTQKTTQTLQVMGLTINSFRDQATGGFLPLIDVVKKLDTGLSTLTPKARAMAEVKIFGQQGVREGAILLDMLHQESDLLDSNGNKYANKLEEMRGEIEKAQGFSTLAAIAMAQTTTNQMKSVGNTIQTVFVDVFNEVSPMIGEIARTLKVAFSSDDFKSGLTTTVSLLVSFTKAVVDNIGAIKDLALGLASLKLAEFAAGGIKAVAVAFDTAAFSAKGLWASLGPIGIAITGLIILWQTYKDFQDRALNNKAAADNLQEYLNNVQKAADKEKQLADLRAKGLSDADVARQQAMQDDVKASDLAVANSKKGTDAMLSDLQKQWNALSENEKIRANMIAEGKTQFGDFQTTTYIDSLVKYNNAIKVQKTQIDALKTSEQQLADNRAKNAKYDDDKAKANRFISPGDTELPGKIDTKALNAAYNEAIKAQEDVIKDASQSLSQFQETEQTRFKSGQIGQLQVINETADAQIAAYQKTAAAARVAAALAANTKDKGPDAERFRAEAQRADASAAQAEKMRLEGTVAAQRTAETTITNLKVKSLEDQGKYVDAANLKWSADGQVALQQAQDDLEKYGDKFPWLSGLVEAYGKVRDDAMNSARLKQDTMEFDAALAQVEDSLKGIKAASFGASVGDTMDAATAATSKFEAALDVAKAKRNNVWVDALTTGAPAAIKEYEEANKDVSAILDKQKTMWQDVADTITKSLSDAFGKSGKALGDLNKAMIDYQQTDNASAETRTKQYGDMAQAASGFFDKQSKGYKALNGIAEVFHAAEMARTLVRTAANIYEAASKFFSQLGVGGWAGIAAMGVTMAGLGYAMTGGGSGADPTQTAAYVQKNQGTGTVLGDATAKSDSIANSLSDLKNNADVTLPLTQKMVSSLQSIEDSMSGLASLTAQAGVGTSSLGLSTGSSGSGILGSIFGKSSTSLTDSGLTFGGNVGSLEQGQGFNQYAVTTTSSSSLFGLIKSSSNNSSTQAVSSAVAQQFGLVFKNLQSSLTSAATSLGKDSDSVATAIDNVVLQTTKVSLMGLTGDDLTNAINNVMSAAMDQIAETVYPDMAAFQKVGEGYAQTVVRVASGVEQADAALKQLGVTAVNYQDIIDKQGGRWS